MPEIITGRIDVLNETSNAVTIFLDANGATIRAGGNELSGLLMIADSSDNNLIRLTGSGEILISDSSGSDRVILNANGELRIIASNNTTALEFAGQQANLIIGGGSNPGDVFIRDSEGEISIFINGGNPSFSIGRNGNAGTVSVRDNAGRNSITLTGQRALLSVGAHQNSGNIEVIDNHSRQVFHIDGETAALRIGTRGNEGDISALDRHGRVVLHFDGNTAGLHIGGGSANDNSLNGDGDLYLYPRNANNGNPNHASIHLDAGGAVLRIGTKGNDGDVIVQDSQNRTVFHFDGNTAGLHVGGGSTNDNSSDGDGDIYLYPSNANNGNPDEASMHLDGNGANIWAGGNGVDGDVFLFPGNGDRTDSDTASIHLNGGQARMKIGGRTTISSGLHGSLYIFDAGGDKSDLRDATIRLTGEGANLKMGGRVGNTDGPDGDIWLFPGDADSTDDDNASIHLNGNTGNIRCNDVIIPGADFAEDFDIHEAIVDNLEPGTVMVLCNDGRLIESYKAFDRKVAGVISGAGRYKPGIVLDKQPNSINRMPVALSGKVMCKADASYGSIEIGDLLTTSPRKGYAMKAIDPIQVFGAVIGKALGNMPDGDGMIPILVALQ